MNSITTYRAAKSVAATIQEHFDYHHLTVQNNDNYSAMLAPKPQTKEIENIIDAAFWASLRREEGRSPKISIAFLPPEKSEHPLVFEHSLPLTPAILTKLAPAVERSGIHIGVWSNGKQLYVWGTTSVIPGLCFVLEVVEPGLLVIKHRRIDGFGKFVNVAVLKGDNVKIVNENGTNLPDCPAILAPMIGISSPVAWNNSLNVLVQLAVSMRIHGRGGTLLVVPTNSDRWRESIIHPISYSVNPTFSELAQLSRQDTNFDHKSIWQAKLDHSVKHIAGLTAVDGATVINDQYDLLAFGVKIHRSSEGEQIEEMLVTEPIVGDEGEIVHPVKNGGTRHLSAAQFVFNQRDALALVASQDGKFTIFSWSPLANIVHAHRVDALLM